MIVRPATAADVPAMVEMARRLHEAAEHVYPFKPDRLDLFIRSLIASPAGFCRVIDDRCGPVGMLVASFGDHPLGAGLYGMEWGFWVDEDARSGRRALALLAAYEADAKRRGCRLLALASLKSGAARGDALGRLYRRLGYAPREQHYDKAL